MTKNHEETALLKQIKEVLLTFPKYWEEDVLLRNRVVEDFRSYDQELIEALLSNKLVKDTYSITLESTNIFKIEEFISMLRYKNYWENSYTKYSNEIGLTSEGKYLNYNTDVVLDFPHKDSILEGGMTKEEQGKKEIYYHNVLAKEEIDTLLSPKILTNIKKYDKNGEYNINEFNDKDNFIIKGNNLIALNTLKERYEGKVKLIYIDPPYFFEKTKASDTFNYNSNFKLSTWLTFMKNRLEIAKDLLADDGAIFISTGNDGQAYLKLLMDDVFGKNNYIETFIWKNSDNANTLGKKSRSDIEFIHAYEKTYQVDKKWIGKTSENDDAPLLNRGNNYNILKFPKGTIFFNIPDGIYEAGIYGRVELIENLIVENGKNKNSIKIKGEFKWGQENLDREISEGTYFLIKTKTFSIRYQKLEASQVSPEKFIDEVYLEKTIGVGVYEDSNTHLNKLGINFRYSKPESLIAFFIRAVTNENDIVLDFFMGSGTTQAVAHKMNRQYIGVEQMDYINTVSVPRLQKVIEGEQGGISEDVDWKGGGSFVYVELASLNERYVKDIQQASSEAELEKVLSTMKESAFLNFKVDLEKVSSKNETYNNLSLEEKKEVLIKVLDMNQLYLSYSEMEDEQYAIPEDVKTFNHYFYQREGVKDE
ncbi:DNA methyltransferase [Facklamia sp. P12932]|uniref:DNA methyltransferase n=1 Tax=Facklamia sp. P12932 TaxID=3421947 RepID=UPI003D172F0B